MKKRLGRARLAFVALATVAFLLSFTCWSGSNSSAVRIFTARKVHTLEPSVPEATAVAVQAGKILALGSLESVQKQLGEIPSEVDSRFADKILLPGFIDPHLHPSLGATILNMDIVSAMEWATPRGRTQAVRGREGFLGRLRELDRERSEDDDWLLVWGYHEPYHGALSRTDLDAISTQRPIFVWQRSVHEMFFNSRALETLGMERQAFDAHPQANWETGHLWETASFDLGGPMVRILASPGRYLEGLSMLSQVIHRGGLTTVAEQGFPQINALAELTLLHLELRRGEAPYRIVLVPNAMYLLREHEDATAAERAAARLLWLSTDRVRVVEHAKYYADGAFFSQRMQMSEPYLDGHHGEWMMTPQEQEAVLEAFWKKGWGIHVHVNGDAGLDLVLDQIEAQQRAHPSPGRRIVLEHYGYAREDQHQRLARMGVEVSNNAYYTHELAPIYHEHGFGPERAADISPLGGLERAGVPVSFHSDYPMAPAEPLRLAWVAVNRIGSDGRVWGADQKLSTDRAVRAITVEAARSLGLEEEIGSIRPGKRADFTVLEADPYEVDPATWKDIPVWGTVLGGVPQPIPPN
ncbi:amidohydrolase [Myxococcota bacterium]|nr:amidohydrolase [Myxococcota bacterium]